ncbi:MAG TPA: endonuclease/exonuclease/phosphatase family protein [Tepidisphaeraceae bacterium]|jgi:endonuclease/exonuclease/phosphatase family metal-dependent hydrolase
MDKLNVAFWNVQNLFDVPAPNTPTRGPRTQGELDAKLDRISGIVGDSFAQRGPDLFAVAEVGTRTGFDALIDRLPGPHPSALRVWEAAAMPEHTGLGLAGRDDRIARLTLLDVWRPTLAARPRILLIECELRAARRPVWVVVNHWKSRMRTTSGPTDAEDRLAGADWLGQRLDLAGEMQCVVMLGDFNCEPTEQPFRGLQLRGTRHASAAINARSAVSTLYNSAWRFMAEPDPWRNPRPVGYQATRPRTTFASGSVILDHLLVSKDALRGFPLSLDESTITYHSDTRAYRYNRNGSIVPVKWTGPLGGPFEGASDHLPLLATFDVA